MNVVHTVDDKMKVALVCIAKDEDNYLGEWIDYHILLGVDEIFVYQNDWRFSLNDTYKNVHFIEFDGERKQLAAYSDFLKNYSRDFDYAIVIDVDEFVCLNCGYDNIKEYLNEFESTSVNHCNIALNWRLYGDNGFSKVVDRNYSLLNRFIRCQNGLNQHIKMILNLKSRINKTIRFINPHCIAESYSLPCVVNSNFSHYVRGPFNENEDLNNSKAWINHYYCKTHEEFMTNRLNKGKADFLRSDPAQKLDLSLFEAHNFNDVESTIARDFYISKMKENDK